MIALLGCVVGALLATDGRARLDSLADATAQGIARYADRRAAIAAGYRRIGTDFPGMGEHWLHPGALLAQRVDPGQPTMLAYANIRGVPTLLGAGFVITTRGDSTAGAPGWPAYWHEHSGLLGDESGARPARATPGDPTATRVWVLHIWTALPNPSDRYDADNWTLPFARLGLRAPDDIDPAIGRAFSLGVADGDGYLRKVLADAGLRTASTAAAVDDAIAGARAVALEVAAHAAGSGLIDAQDSARLRTAWETLASRLRATLGPGAEPILAPPHAHHGDP